MCRRSDHRYRDHEDSRFYQANGLSPEETWETLTRELALVLDRTRQRPTLSMDANLIRMWHGAIFRRLFPREGGFFRQGPAFFGVVMPNGGIRQLEGAQPDVLRRELAAVCAEFNELVARLDPTDATSVLARTRAAAILYTGILRVHPFVDGNHRVGFVALSSALWSLGLPNVEFESDDEMIAHDDALVPALLSPDGSVEPFARLLAKLIDDATREGI